MTDKPDIQPDGERYRQLKNGAIYDMDAKRIAANPGGGTSAITQANASEYHQLYARKRLEAELAASRGLALQPDPKYGRVSVEAARVVGQMTGFLAERGRNGPDPTVNTLTIQLNNDGLAAIMSGILPILRNSGDNDE